MHISDVRCAIFFPIVITAHIFYHDKIIITIYIPSICEQYYIDIGDTCSRVYNTELQYNITNGLASLKTLRITLP